MQLTIESPGLEIDNKLQKLIQEKFENLVKIYSRVTKCLVVLKREKDDHKEYFLIEARLSVPQKMLFANSRAGNFEIALYKVIGSLAHQLNRFKDKRQEIW